MVMESMGTPSGIGALPAQGGAGLEPEKAAAQSAASKGHVDKEREPPPDMTGTGFSSDVLNKEEAATAEPERRLAAAQESGAGAAGAVEKVEGASMHKEVGGSGNVPREAAAEFPKANGGIAACNSEGGTEGAKSGGETTDKKSEGGNEDVKSEGGSACGNSAASGATAVAPKAPRVYYKKRKVCLFVAYKGAGYQGMQRNPGAKTIEGALEKALFRAGAILEEDLGELWKIDWKRAARTDKGVSALAQVVSARLVIEPEGLVERINKHLPKQIRILGYVRVTGGFNAKELCDRRRYEYYLPTFAFDPKAHTPRDPDAAPGAAPAAPARDATGQGAAQGAPEASRGEGPAESTVMTKAEGREGTGAAKGGECTGAEGWGSVQAGEAAKINENGSCPQEAMNPQAEGAEAEGAAVAAAPGDPSEQAAPGDPTEQLAKRQKVEEGTRATQEEAGRVKGDPPPATAGQEESTEGSGSGKTQEGHAPQAGFVFDAACLARLNELLQGFKGTHCFHNYTAGITSFDSAAHRFIVSFEATGVVEVAGMPLVRLMVVGQSFLLHQIRKMVGMAVAIMRGHCPETLLKDALRKDRKINVPMAPEVGLMLAECFYHSYNRKWSKTHEELGLARWEAAVEEFKHSVVLPHVVETERLEHTVAKWLCTLNDRNYKDFALARAAAEGRL